MNWEDYIESGLLELYVMGALSEEEMLEIRSLEVKHPELAAEIDRIQSDLINFAEVSSPVPSPGFMDKVKAQISESNNAKESQLNPDSNLNEAKIISLRSNLRMARSMAAAILLLFIFSATVNYFQYQKVKESSKELAQIQEELQSQKLFEAQIQRTNFDQQKHFNQLLAHINDSNTVVVRLEGQAIDPNAHASVYWNRQNKVVIINSNSLPETDDDHQYQLWALVDGQPVDAGIFEYGTEMQRVKLVQSAQAFAVTLEPKGGSVNPTLEKLYVVGAVPKV